MRKDAPFGRRLRKEEELVEEDERTSREGKDEENGEGLNDVGLLKKRGRTPL